MCAEIIRVGWCCLPWVGQLLAPAAESTRAYAKWPQIPFVDPLFGVSWPCECLYNPRKVLPTLWRVEHTHSRRLV